MAKNTKALSGPAKRKYFRDALQAESGVAADAAQRLTEKFDGEVAQLRVRQHVALSASRAKPAEAASSGDAPQQTTRQPQANAQAPAPLPVPAAFDPHAFSLIVVMTKQGAAGLQAKLDAIDSAEHLKALARAQHVAIDGAGDRPDQLRAAIIAGTAQRIADRRAAAS